MSTIKSNWCRFLFNEGIMPGIISRKLKRFKEDEENFVALVADILLNKDKADIPDVYNLPSAEVIKASFNLDKELLSWIENERELLEIIKNYANKGSLFTKIVDEACISCIVSCDFIPEKIRNAYLNFSKPNDAFGGQTPSDIKQNFRSFLCSKNYSLNTINSYISGINNIGKIKNIEQNLWQITDANVMQKLMDDFEKNEEHLYDDYKDKDMQSRKILSNSLKRYVEFLKECKEN